MIQIRTGVFETNSSSTHSMCICTEEDYLRFLRGEMLLDTYSGKLVDKEEAEVGGDRLGDRYVRNVYEIGEYWSSADVFNEHFTTPSGDKMVVFGVFGYDG